MRLVSFKPSYKQAMNRVMKVIASASRGAETYYFVKEKLGTIELLKTLMQMKTAIVCDSWSEFEDALALAMKEARIQSVNLERAVRRYGIEGESKWIRYARAALHAMTVNGWKYVFAKMWKKHCLRVELIEPFEVEFRVAKGVEPLRELTVRALVCYPDYVGLRVGDCASQVMLLYDLGLIYKASSRDADVVVTPDGISFDAKGAVIEHQSNVLYVFIRDSDEYYAFCTYVDLRLLIPRRIVIGGNQIFIVQVDSEDAVGEYLRAIDCGLRVMSCDHPFTAWNFALAHGLCEWMQREMR